MCCPHEKMVEEKDGVWYDIKLQNALFHRETSRDMKTHDFYFDLPQELIA